MAVGKGEVKIPKNINKTEVDVSGKTVMPGLIDSHLHLIGPKTDNYWEETLVRPWQLGLIKSVYDAIELLSAGYTLSQTAGHGDMHYYWKMRAPIYWKRLGRRSNIKKRYGFAL